MTPDARPGESLKGRPQKDSVINVPLDGLLSDTECLVEGSETCERVEEQHLRCAARFILRGAEIQLLTTCRIRCGNKKPVTAGELSLTTDVNSSHSETELR